jgi:hypothetical protein
MPNNLYGIIIDGKLRTDSALFEDYKPIIYAEIPDFDEKTQYLIQSEPLDRGTDIYLGIEVKTMVQDIKSESMDFIGI